MTIVAPFSSKLTAETLLNLGFVDIASWKGSDSGIAYTLDGTHAETNRLRLDERNALYAFVREDEVLYIGKTARTVRKRFLGYCRPNPGQRTNWRCNGKIKEFLEQGREIRIFVFTPISQLRYGVFDVNLAAGLEDALIAEFDPPWNGRNRGQPISEEAEREEVDEGNQDSSVGSDAPDVQHTFIPVVTFVIKLGEAYYGQGLINPGVEASRHLGAEGEPVEVLFGDGTESVFSSINRTANRIGSVRVVGRNGQIANWFQRNFRRGDVVQAHVLDANRILLLVGAHVDAPIGDCSPQALKWERDGSVCPICEGRGRESPSYPGALCRSCERELVDDEGRPVTMWNTNPLGSGIAVETLIGTCDGQDVSIYARGIVCWAREVRWGGVAVQPVEVWETAYPKVPEYE